MLKEDVAPIRFTLKSVFVVLTAVAVVLAFGFGVLPLLGAAWAIPHLWKKGQSGWAGAVVAGLLILPLLGVGTSVSVRLDTGDQRTEVWGIPISWAPMREPARSSLLTLKGADSRRRWRWCAQQVGSNNANAMVRRFYVDAAAWVDVDPEVAQFVVADIASYVETTHATSGLPDCTTLIWPDVIDRSTGTPRVLDAWEHNPDVLAYLAQKGYNPSSAKHRRSTPPADEQSDEREPE